MQMTCSAPISTALRSANCPTGAPHTATVSLGSISNWPRLPAGENEVA